MSVTIGQVLATLGIDEASASVYQNGEYAVIQRDPQPGEEGILIGANVKLILVNMDYDPNDLSATLNYSDTMIYINGSLAGKISKSSGFSYYAPWQAGDDNDWFMPGDESPFAYWIFDGEQISPPVFASEQVVPVQVALTSPAPLTVDWTFTCQDLTSPSLISAEPISQKVARLTYSEAMATTGTGSALLASAYTITRQNVDPEAGVTLEVESVTEVSNSSGTQFDLTFNWEQTPGCQYQVDVATTVTDIAGNPIQ